MPELTDAFGVKIMQLTITLFLAAIGVSACFAQYSERLDRCMEKADNQTAMHYCANEEARRAEMELGEIYKKLLAAAGSQSVSVAKIRATEEAWIRYRDAYIEAMYPESDKQAAYGSSFPTEADLLWAKLTYRQIDALREMLKQYEPLKR